MKIHCQWHKVGNWSVESQHHPTMAGNLRNYEMGTNATYCMAFQIISPNGYKQKQCLYLWKLIRWLFKWKRGSVYLFKFCLKSFILLQFKSNACHQIKYEKAKVTCNSTWQWHRILRSLRFCRHIFFWKELILALIVSLTRICVERNMDSLYRNFLEVRKSTDGRNPQEL